MKIRMCVLLLVLLVSEFSESAEIAFRDPPITYVPGSRVEFSVELADIVDLASYNVEVVFRAEGPRGTTDLVLSGALPESQYLFADGSRFAANDNVWPDNAQSLTLSDFLETGSVDVVAGQNDRLAIVAVELPADFSDAVVVSFQADSLFLDDPNLQPVADSDTIASGLADQTFTMVPVPEPASGFMVLVAIVSWSARRRRVPT